MKEETDPETVAYISLFAIVYTLAIGYIVGTATGKVERNDAQGNKGAVAFVLFHFLMSGWAFNKYQRRKKESE